MTLSSLSAASQASPLTRLLGTISSASASGAISATDATALSVAATDVDAGLKADRPAGTRPSGPPSPEDFKAKVDGLVDAQVASGKLTSDQASELKDLFAKAAPQGPAGAGGAPHGPPPGPPPADATDDDDDATSSINAAGGIIADLLQSFLDGLRETRSDASAYGAAGTTGTGPASGGGRFSALLIDFQA